MLEFKNVSLGFKNLCLFNEFSLIVDEPRVLISGPNGSGKTTLLLMAAGLIQPDSGEISFKQQPVVNVNSKKSIGISASKVNLPGFFSVQELLDFHSRQFNCSVCEKWLEQFSLQDYLKTKVADLSLGNYKKLSLMTAIMHQPDLLLLDEPANGLDEKARVALNLLLSEYSGQVIIASHETLAEDHHQVRHIQLQRNTST